MMCDANISLWYRLLHSNSATIKMKRDLSEILVNFVSVFRFRFGCRAVLLATNVCLSRCLTFLVMSRVVWQCSGEWKSAKSELVLLPSSR